MTGMTAGQRAAERAINMPTRAIAAALLRRHPQRVPHKELFDAAAEVDPQLLRSRAHFKKVIRELKGMVRGERSTASMSARGN